MRTIKVPHLALLTVVLFVVGLWALWPQSSTPQQTAPSAEPSTTSIPTKSSQAPTKAPQNPPATPTNPESTKFPPEKKQRQIAAAFAAEYSHDETQQRWLNDLEPLVTPELLEGFQYTDTRLRPKGPPEKVQAALNGTPSFVITYPGQTRVRCTLTPAGSSWKVDSVEPFRPPRRQRAKPNLDHVSRHRRSLPEELTLSRICVLTTCR